MTGAGKGLFVAINCGSSSIKCAAFEQTSGGIPRAPAWRGQVDGITGVAPQYSEAGQAVAPLEPDAAHPYASALDHVLRRIDLWRGEQPIRAFSHRVVHGGARYSAPVRIVPEVLTDLRGYIPLAPLHQPFALEAIERLLARDSDIPQIACFDTAFHHTMPDVEKMLPLNWAHWEAGVRRYGFHGLSYQYLSVALAERHGDAARGRTLVAHLGSGASLCGMVGLESRATTMGFSALDGLMMGTRSGALDPGVVLHLMEIEKLSLAEAGRLLYHGSGLLGVSGISADVRVLLAREAAEPRAAAALALYVRRIIRETGAMAAALGGLDMLAFTAGVGEHNGEIRKRICAGLGFLGVALDADANARNAAVLSTPQSRVLVACEPTNEEWIAVRSAAERVKGG